MAAAARTRPELGLALGLSVLLLFFFVGAEAKCRSSCDLGLASYYVWDGSNLTFIAHVTDNSIEDILSYNTQITSQDSVAVGTKLIVPFTPCECISNDYLANIFNYSVNSGDTYDIIATKYYSNLTTTEWLQSWNSYPPQNIPDTAQLNVTVNCSCGDSSVSKDYGLFVTYPLRPGDNLSSVATEFGVNSSLVQEYNPNTNFSQGSGLVFIPGKDTAGNFPALKISSGISSGAIAGISVGGVAVVLFLAGCIYFLIYRRKKVKAASFLSSASQPHSIHHEQGSGSSFDKDTQSTTLAGAVSSGRTAITVDKSVEFSYEELANATNNFSMASKIGEGGRMMSPSEVVDKITSEDALQFEFSTIEAATDNFSDANKLGFGGFGVVYKGRLSDGQEIAVKRLSVNSTQGEVEFKNEVTLVTKLQHRNLVSLLGFCMEGKQLIYEFVPNKSLDYYLFDPVKRADLDWEKCYKIIEGIARGLLYLHVDSSFKIIHRDLKPSNILLDAKMNPKISDFGLAKLVVMGQTRENTNRIAGTRGYMPPEYAIKGQFSEKSDIYSFGVILLEIISGKRINGFYHWESSQNLLGYAWRLWHEGKELEFIEPLLRDTSPTTEVLRCLLIGLLCVQGDAECRPTMSTVILMLQQTLNTLPLPRQPPASMASTSLQENRNPLNPKITSVNEVTLSGFSPR